MHLWPSMRIRDSFKIAYLKKLEWNLQRMKSQQQSSGSNQDKLLDNNNNDDKDDMPTSKTFSCFDKAALIFREILMVLSCCYCCFCCGACVDQDED